MKERRLSEKLNGPVKQLFIADYHLSRLAGLTRSQAIKVCRRKYEKHV